MRSHIPGRCRHRVRACVCVCHILIKPDQDVAPHARCEMHLGLEIHLDAHHQRRVLELAVGVDGSLEEVA